MIWSVTIRQFPEKKILYHNIGETLKRGELNMVSKIVEKRIIVQEKTNVDYVREHGSTGQKYAVGIFDIDGNGELEVNEVTLFNSCNFKYNKNNGQLTIYDRQVQANGQNGTIVINALNKNMPHGIDQGLNPGCPDGFYGCDIVQDDVLSYGNLKYEMDNNGNRMFYHNGIYNAKGPIMKGFDRIEFNNKPEYNDIRKAMQFSRTGVQEPWYSGIVKNLKIRPYVE